MAGYIKLYKQITENPIWSDKPFARGQAWIDLLLMANYADGEMFIKGSLIKVERGQVFRTVKFLAERWGWSDKKTKGFLSYLDGRKMVSLKGLPQGTLITIEKYTEFQGEGITEEPSEDLTKTEPRPNQDLTVTHKRIKNKKNKEEKEEKNIYTRYGEFNNVLLTDNEYTKLVERFPMDYQERIESLSQYMKQFGKRYKSHYATILSWARKDRSRKKPEVVPGNFANVAEDWLRSER